MADITTNSLLGISKTLKDVVIPAIPADDPLALQELKMVVRYLDFARERVDHLYARARFELTFYAGLATSIVPMLAAGAPGEAESLKALGPRASAQLAEPGASIEHLRSLTRDLTYSISTLLERVDDLAILAQVERRVVAASAEITAFDRSWYAPLKLERFPDEVKPLHTFIPVGPMTNPR